MRNLRMLLAALMALAVFMGSVLPASAGADEPTETAFYMTDTDGPSDDGINKILHTCGHCQSHHTASLNVAMAVGFSRVFTTTSWQAHSEHHDSAAWTPPAEPPKA